MMNQPLAINDIILPDVVSLWPPAIGWWLLFFLLTALIAAGLFLSRRYQRYWVFRRPALKAIKTSFKQYQHDQDKQQLLMALMTTIKRLNITLYGGNNKSDTNLKASDFLCELNRNKEDIIFFSEKTINVIDQALYHKADDFLVENFYQECIAWVKQYKLHKEAALV